MYISRQQRSGRKGLGDAITGNSCSSFDFFFNKPAWDACLNSAAVAQIESVPINAASAGYPASVVTVAQQVASQQQAQVPADTANIDAFYGAGAGEFATGVPLWVWLLGGGLAALVAVKALG